MTEHEMMDCSKCPAHGRQDQRIDFHDQCINDLTRRLERARAESKTNCKEVWQEMDGMKERLSKLNDDHQRRLGEKVPIRHAVVALGVIVSIFTTVIGFNVAYNSRVEDKLDLMMVEITRLNTVVEERGKINTSMSDLLKEVQQIRKQGENNANRNSGTVHGVPRNVPPRP